MRTIDGRLTFLISADNQTRLELQCDSSGAVIARIDLSNDDVCAILSRQSYRPCKVEILDRSRIDYLGSTMKMDKMSFKMPKTSYENRKEVASNLAKEQCPKGWEPDTYFGSQGSFFTKDGQDYATCTIRQYVHEETARKGV